MCMGHLCVAITHVWRGHPHVAVTCVWRGHSCMPVICMWRRHSHVAVAACGGDTHMLQLHMCGLTLMCCYIQVPEQFKSSKLMYCGNKSKSFLIFISFIVDS